MGQLFRTHFDKLEEESRGAIKCQGQGLMWGGMWQHPDAGERKKANQVFKLACQREGVWPYFVPVGGFMITPVMDIEPEVPHSSFP